MYGTQHNYVWAEDDDWDVEPVAPVASAAPKSGVKWDGEDEEAEEETPQVKPAPAKVAVSLSVIAFSKH